MIFKGEQTATEERVVLTWRRLEHGPVVPLLLDEHNVVLAWGPGLLAFATQLGINNQSTGTPS